MARTGRTLLAGIARALFCALLASFSLLVFEVGIRLTELDMVALRPLLLWLSADLPVYSPRENPEIIYGLKPGARERLPDTSGGYRTVTVNSLGFRDRPRSARKPAGTFRIVCLGFSHMYGAEVSDDETFPYHLEETLNKGFQGRFEVWNAGANAYSLKQAVELGKEIASAYSPDLMILPVSNLTRRSFLMGQSYPGYFRKNPRLFLENIWFPFSQASWEVKLLLHSALYRTICIYLSYGRLHPDMYLPYWRTMSFEALEDFLASCAGRTRVALLYCSVKGAPPEPRVPRFSLYSSRYLPAGLPLEYFMIHPPGYIYKAQAQVAAQELAREFPALFRVKAPGRTVVEPLRIPPGKRPVLRPGLDLDMAREAWAEAARRSVSD